MTLQEQSQLTIGFIGMDHMGSHMAPPADTCRLSSDGL